ncbi:PAS domain-containing protein [Haloarcula litorea]|uniref:PAS domain-containing protein n=1 Tax=Haloarcula litorea TaxID=3032579 RepID=UPI0023E8013A|nr:PAS domain-containing protein [Halomicroarcula sp. GDY20]
MPSDTDSEAVRRQLYEVVEDEELTLAETQRRLLATARDALGVENGHVQRFDADGTHTVVASVGGPTDLFPPDSTLDHTTTYCRRTVERDAAVALSDAPAQGWADDPAYEEHGLDCYLGTTVFVRGETYGTVCFVSREARGDEFDAEEKLLVELVARLIGRALDGAAHERELAARERELSDTQDKYASLLETAPNAILLIEPETGAVVEANETAAELTGYDRAALRERTVFDLHPDDDRERYERVLERCTEDDGTWDRVDGRQLVVTRRDGTAVPVEISANVVELDGDEYVHSIVRDVTDRRERERELRVKSRALEAASVGITIADATDDDLPVVYANPEFERLTGYDRDDVLGRNCRFLQGANTDETAVAELRAGIADREPVRTELLNYRADGTPFWNEVTLAPVTDEDGDVTHFVGFQRDVTVRKRRRRLVGVLNRVLRHNLRNDMTVVGGYAEVLAERTDGETADIARRIEATAADLTALSEKARTLEAAVTDPQPLDQRDAVADVTSVAAELSEEHPEVGIRVDAPDHCAVMATDRLRTVLRELGENAATHGAPPVTFRVERDGGRVAIHVRDAGDGIEDTERLALETGRETQLEHGTGLGFRLVDWIVTGLGGTVTTADAAQTTVTVRLAAPPDDPRAERDDRSHRGAVGTRSP